MTERPTMAGRLRGKVAVVTCGGNGIGRACCTRFAEEDARLVVADILDAAAKETATQITGTGRDAIAVALDATDPDANGAMVGRAADAFGSFDVLVTAAGVSHVDYVSGDTERDMASFGSMAQAVAGPHRLLLALDLPAWQRVLDVNLIGNAARRAGRRPPHGRARRRFDHHDRVDCRQGPRGRPARLSGVRGRGVDADQAAARSLAKAGNRVNAIGPGYIETNMTKVLTEVPAVRHLALAQIPMGRVARPDEVANVALCLASDDASYMTGEILHPDGCIYTD